jgi:hypothetical protein
MLRGLGFLRSDISIYLDRKPLENVQPPYNRTDTKKRKKWFSPRERQFALAFERVSNVNRS